MPNMKYINFKHLGLVIFEEHIQHSTMRNRLDDMATSAGFVSLPRTDDCGNEASCYGESVSMGLKSCPEDTTLLRSRLNRY